MLQPGTAIGRYEIQRRLGRGGMGTVWVAHDPVLGRMVAVKVFHGELDLPDAAERFAREARSAAALNHANIVTVYDYGDYDSQPYIVMEYIQGETLAEVIRRKAPFSVAEKLRCLEELCAGVGYAHRGGIIHRDIKPANLMFDRSGHLKVLDFGIARMLGRLSTRATGIIGTPGYMAPEQLVGGEASSRSDLFSVGVVCYEFLAYAEAFPGETGPTITYRILNEAPVPLTQLVPGIHPELVSVVNLALEKNPDRRLASVDALRATMEHIRRQLENQPGEVAPTILRPGSILRRRTGPESKPLSDSAGVGPLTPPPDADREALVRQRTAQIEGALEQARGCLALGDLDLALDACVQALALDGAHVGALDLERTVQAAYARRRAVALLEEARDELGRGALTGAQDLLQQARALDPDAADVRRLERDLRLARVDHERRRHRAEAAEKAVDEAGQALARGDIERALASARHALDFDPESAHARALEADALRRLDEETGVCQADIPPLSAELATTITPPGRRTPSPSGPSGPVPPVPAAKPGPAPAKKPSRRAWVDGARVWLTSARGTVTARLMSLWGAIGARPKREKVIAGWSGLAVLVVVAAITGLMLAPGPVPPTGTVILEAVPWATITGIEREDGTRPALPSPASTPFAITLPAGTYRVRLVGPPPESESRLITVQVQASGMISTPAERFRTLTAEEYFEPYLATPPSPEAPPGEESASSWQAAPAQARTAGVQP